MLSTHLVFIVVRAPRTFSPVHFPGALDYGSCHRSVLKYDVQSRCGTGGRSENTAHRILRRTSIVLLYILSRQITGSTRFRSRCLPRHEMRCGTKGYRRPLTSSGSATLAFDPSSPWLVVPRVYSSTGFSSGGLLTLPSAVVFCHPATLRNTDKMEVKAVLPSPRA